MNFAEFIAPFTTEPFERKKEKEIVVPKFLEICLLCFALLFEYSVQKRKEKREMKRGREEI